MESKRSKYILSGLTLLCVLLIGITSLKDGILEPLRTGVGYFLIPIQTGVNRVGTGLYNELTDISRLKTALDENDRLKIQVDRLTEENNRLQAQQFELNRLRQLYELDQEYMQYNKIGARVIARDSEKWFQVFRIKIIHFARLTESYSSYFYHLIFSLIVNASISMVRSKFTFARIRLSAVSIASKICCSPA